MGIEKNPNNHDLLFVPRGVVSELARLLRSIVDVHAAQEKP